jgi:hypothetical protein
MTTNQMEFGSLCQWLHDGISYVRHVDSSIKGSDTILSTGIARVYAYVTTVIRVYDDVTKIVMRIAKFLCGIVKIPVAQRENQLHRWSTYDTILSTGIARVYAYVTIAIRVYDDVTKIVMRIAKFLCGIVEIPVAQLENQSHWEIFSFAPKFRVPPPNPITRCLFARIARPISIARYMRRNLTSR